MKKVFVFFAIFALIGSMAFAQIEAGGRITFTLMQTDTDGANTQIGWADDAETIPVYASEELYNTDTFYGMWVNFAHYTGLHRLPCSDAGTIAGIQAQVP